MSEISTTVATYQTSEEAYIVRNRLSFEGVEAFVVDEHLVALNFMYGPALGGVKLQVRKKDKDHAVSALKEINAQAKKNRERDSSDNKKAFRAFQSAGFALVFQPLILYSIWIIIGLLKSKRGLSARNRKRLIYSALINLAVAGQVALIAYLSL